MVLFGHSLFSNLRGGNLLYFFEGSASLAARILAFCFVPQDGAKTFLHGHFDGGVEAMLEKNLSVSSVQTLLFILQQEGSFV